MAGSYPFKSIQVIRQLVAEFSHLYEDEGDLEAAMKHLEKSLSDRRSILRNNVLYDIHQKYPELEI